MKRSLLAILIIGALFIGATAKKNVSRDNDDFLYRVYGVAFYNLENLFDTINNNGDYDKEFSPAGARQWDSKKYWSKINKLAYAISQFKSANTPGGPAIIGVSEIENITVLNDLVRADALKDWTLRVVHHDSPDRRGVDVGLLYNPRYFKVLNVTNHTLRIDGYESFRTRDQMCVTGMLGKKKVSVIVNHWPSRLGGQERSSYLREAAASLSKHIADSLWTIDPSQGVIIMGDLNDDPHDKSCAVALGAVNDKVRKKKGVDPHGFYNPWWETLDRGIGTLAYKSQWNLFDQIIISGNLLPENCGNLELRYLRNVVHNFEFLRGNEGNRQGYPLRTFASGVWLDGYSDHFPTEIFLAQPFEKK